MGDFNVADTSIPSRLSTAEQELHTVRFRLDQLDAHRLPDRMTGVEATMQNMQQELADINATSHRTNMLVNTVRAEINEDIGKLEEAFTERTLRLQSSVDSLTGRIIGTVSTTIVLVGAAAWIVEHFGLIPLLLQKVSGG